VDDPSIQWLRRWLQQVQGVAVTPEMLIESARTVARIGGLSRAAAAALPFDTDPTGFGRRLDTLAGRNDGDV